MNKITDTTLEILKSMAIVLQAYIKEAPNRELRLHIWHPDLCAMTNKSGSATVLGRRV